MIFRLTVLTTALIGPFAPALAQDGEERSATRDTIIVEGTRLGQTAAESGTSVSILTADDLELLDFDFAIDAIANAPGVSVNQNGAFGGVGTVRIRGASGEQTLVLIDGVPVNDASSVGGGFNFATLDTESIERIEVLKGPQSTFWGTDAIGGVISITTKRPEPGLGGAAFVEGGSFSTFRGGASLEQAGHIGDFRIAALGVASKGISKADKANGNTEKDGYDAVTLNGKGGVNLGRDVRLEGAVLWTDSDADFDSFSFSAQGNVADGDENVESEELTAHIALKAPLFDGKLQNLLLVGYSEIDRRNFSGGAPGFSAKGERTIFRYQGTLAVNHRNTFSFGAEREEANANGADSSINGYFLLYEYKPVDALTLTGGLRVDDHDRFGSETTGRVALAYRANENITLRASWGEGFKAPTIFQSTFVCGFCGQTEPNANLQPERSKAFDIGADLHTDDGRAQFSVTYFDQESTNLIDFDFTAGYANIAFVDSRGVEASGAYQLAPWLNISANYAWIRAKDGAGAMRPRVPEHTGDVIFAFDPAGPLSGSVLLRYNGDETNADGTILGDWVRVDLTGRYRISNALELYGRIENLFDAHYQQVLGYGTPGVSGSAGIRLRY
ncbi:MAG: TonB-dependent receptor [Parvularculaceae bacterium]|nr:TonB-dependent receptor [Parvularculaceae bacterium]